MVSVGVWATAWAGRSRPSSERRWSLRGAMAPGWLALRLLRRGSAAAGRRRRWGDEREGDAGGWGMKMETVFFLDRPTGSQGHEVQVPTPRTSSSSSSSSQTTAYVCDSVSFRAAAGGHGEGGRGFAFPDLDLGWPSPSLLKVTEITAAQHLHEERRSAAAATTAVADLRPRAPPPLHQQQQQLEIAARAARFISQLPTSKPE